MLCDRFGATFRRSLCRRCKDAPNLHSETLSAGLTGQDLGGFAFVMERDSSTPM
jgi:hypothetical protein